MVLRGLCFLLALAIGPLHAHAQTGARDASPVPVVATFSILADIAREVGGDRIAVTTLVGFGGDAHVYTPGAPDARAVAAAKLLIINGLGLEGWLPRLVQSSGSAARIVTASDGIALLKRGGAADPHAWQAVGNARIYATNIRDALIALDPAGADDYRARAARYDTQLAALDAECRAAVAALPPDRRKVISTHGAFGYLAQAYGLAFLAPIGLSTDAEPSARDLVALVTQIKTERIPALFLENGTDDRLIRGVAAETGAAIGGTLYADSLTQAGDAPTYIALVRHNIRTLTAALARP